MVVVVKREGDKPIQHSIRAHGETLMTSGGSTPTFRHKTNATHPVFTCPEQQQQQQQAPHPHEWIIPKEEANNRRSSSWLSSKQIDGWGWKEGRRQEDFFFGTTAVKKTVWRKKLSLREGANKQTLIFYRNLELFSNSKLSLALSLSPGKCKEAQENPSFLYLARKCKFPETYIAIQFVGRKKILITDKKKKKNPIANSMRWGALLPPPLLPLPLAFNDGGIGGRAHHLKSSSLLQFIAATTTHNREMRRWEKSGVSLTLSFILHLETTPFSSGPADVIATPSCRKSER